MLGTENDDRTVHLAPVMFLLDGTRILIETSTASRKARNLAARPRASVVVHTADAAWAFGSGPATITRGAEARRLNERIRAKYLTDRGQRACGDLLAELDDITIVVTPTRWLSWDMNELLANIAARGADLDEIERLVPSRHLRPTSGIGTRTRSEFSAVDRRSRHRYEVLTSSPLATAQRLGGATLHRHRRAMGVSDRLCKWS